MRTVELSLDQHAVTDGDGIRDDEGDGDLVADALAKTTRESRNWLHFIQDIHRELEALSRETDSRTLISGLEYVRDEVERWLKFVSK